MSGSSLNSQIVYGWSGAPKPIAIEQEGGEKSALSVDDFVQGMTSAEEALGQKILQDNNDKLRILDNITEQGLTDLAVDGSATSAQLATAINKFNAILTNLVIAGKQ